MHLYLNSPCNAPYIHPNHDSILELRRTFPNGYFRDAFHLCMLGNVCFFLLLLLSADFFSFFFVQNIFQEHSSTVKRFGSRPGPFGFKLFANVISRREKSPLASKELNVRAFFFKECTFLSLMWFHSVIY